MPDRFDGAVLGGDLGRRAARARGPRDVGGQCAARQPQRRPGAAVHAAVRPHPARSRLHQGLSARAARERRPVHARRHVVHARVRAAGRRRSGRRAVLADQSQSITRAPARRFTATRSSPTWSAPTSTRRRRTSGAAAGPGTRARPAGCIAPPWREFSASACADRCCASIPAFPRSWPGFEVTYKHGSSRYRIAVENPHGVCRGIIRASLDGRDISVSPVRHRARGRRLVSLREDHARLRITARSRIAFRSGVKAWRSAYRFRRERGRVPCAAMPRSAACESAARRGRGAP